MTTTLLIACSFLLAALAVWLFTKATRNYPRLLDVPNERSSHTAPVARGAGVAIVAVALTLYLWIFGFRANFAYVLAALVIATLSFLDDLISLPIALRLGVHCATAAVFVVVSLNLQFMVVPDLILALGYVVFIVWVINAYNFMDGIDGLAGVQGIVTSLGWILFGVATGSEPIESMGSILLGSCAGFLVFNWQPAKVFMGDVGSTFLGFTFAVIPLLQSTEVVASMYSLVLFPALLLWLFMFDTAYTRLGQILVLKPFWKAHRDHLYQRIVCAGTSHARVASFFGIVGLVLAGTLAMRSRIGYVPLVTLMFIGPGCLLLWAGKKRLT